MRCPSCRTLVLAPATALTGTGTLMTCPRCPATWIYRSGDETDLAARDRPPPLIERGPLTIEGNLAPPPSAQSRYRASGHRMFGRHAISLVTGTLMTGALAAMLAFVAALTLSPGVSAGPDTKTPETRTMEGNR